MLYIMRHGKTEWNAKKLLQGRTDIPLNDDGRCMAARANEEYKAVQLDICYCSPLMRARETAEIVLKNRKIPIIADDRLIEMSFGKYEGEPDFFVEKKHPLRVMVDEPESYKTSIGGAETFVELYNRTGAFIAEVVKPQLRQGRNILIVGHGAMNASIVCQIKNMPIKDFWTVGLEQCKMLRLL